MDYSNIEAEQGLIGSLFMDNNGIHDLTLHPEHFAHPLHGEIFEKIREYVLSGRIASPVILKDVFASNPYIQDVGIEYLADMMQSVLTTANNSEYEKIIKDLATKRIISEKLNNALNDLRSEDGEKVAAKVAIDIQDSFISGGKAKTKTEVHEEIIKDLTQPKNFTPTGLDRLDEAMGGGLYQGWTYGLAGAEKSGKTTFAYTISSNINDAGTKHAYVALEMGSKQIEERNLARREGFNAMKFLDKRNRPHDFEERVKRNNYVDNTYYLDMAGASIQDIFSELLPLIYKYKIEGAIIDYLQIIGGRNNSGTEEAHYRAIAQMFADFGRKHGIFILILAQLNKDNDLFMGGGLTKACDQLYFIQRCEEGYASDNHRWLKMRASRYTPMGDLGDESNPSFLIRTDIGSFVESL